MQWLDAYNPTIWAMAVTAGLFLLQMLIADFAGIKARHQPGTPVPVDPSLFLFRASRAHANTNESIAAFVLLALTGILANAPAAWLNGLAWVYVAGRAGHMLFYYAKLATARTIAFTVGVLGLLGMLLVCLMALLR